MDPLILIAAFNSHLKNYSQSDRSAANFSQLKASLQHSLKNYTDLNNDHETLPVTFAIDMAKLIDEYDRCNFEALCSLLQLGIAALTEANATQTTII